MIINKPSKQKELVISGHGTTAEGRECLAQAIERYDKYYGSFHGDISEGREILAKAAIEPIYIGEPYVSNWTAKTGEVYVDPVNIPIGKSLIKRLFNLG